jgi:chitodextrinase
MYLNPAAGTVSVGDTIDVAIRVNDGFSGTPTVALPDPDAYNAVKADVSYPTSLLQFVSIDTTGSRFDIVATKTASNGVVTFEGGITPQATTPVSAGVGYGDNLVAIVRFKALAQGSAPLAVATTSALYRHSDSTNILAIRTGSTLTVNDSTAPLAPGTITPGTRTVNSIAMSWGAATDNVGITSYRVFRNGTQVGTSTTTSFNDTGLTPNTSYNYTVKAVDAAGNISPANTSTAISTLADTTAPSVPTGLSAPSKTMNSISLSWSPSTDDVAVKEYRVSRNGSQVGVVTSTSFTDTGLSPGTSYSYTIVAADTAGNVSAASSPAFQVATSTDSQPPSVPANLRLGASSTTAVVLNWDASIDNVGVTGYKVYRGGVQIGTATTTSYTDNTVVAGSTYSYTVAAYDALNNTSAQSAPLNQTIWKVADVNHDNQINIIDLSLILGNYGYTTSSAPNPNADINHDGKIDIVDISLILTNYGK